MIKKHFAVVIRSERNLPMSLPNPIEAVVLPLKTEAIKKAEQFARDEVAHVRAELKKHDNDIHAAAPYPDSSHVNFHAALFQYRLFNKLTAWRPDQIVRPTTPCLVDVKPALVAKHVAETCDAAAAFYDAYVVKLVKKIGPVKSATLEGNHVWAYSLLYVLTESGRHECWKTQSIMNRSK
jgi:hypothetical protein